MKVLVLGAGKISAELLKRLTDAWQATLVDKSRERLTDFSSRFASISRVVEGDASSPVVLEEAGLEDQDYVLALTDRDKVNLAACDFAAKAGIKHLLALVHDPELLPAFRAIGARTLSVAAMPARSIYHYLQDPRIDVTPIARGRGEIMEVDVGDRHWTQGTPVGLLHADDWRLVALFRGQDMLFPDHGTQVESGDRLVFVGRPDMFEPVCSLLDCAQPSFPLAYGQTLLAALTKADDAELSGILDEILHLAQMTKIKRILLLCRRAETVLKDKLATWSESLDIETRPVSDNPVRDLQVISESESVGLVALPPPQTSFLASFTKAALVSLAHSLPCPVLVAKQSAPFKKLLVPFHGTDESKLALTIGLDLAQQLDAELAAVVVSAPDFLHGSEDNGQDFVAENLAVIRDMAHIHKIPIEEMVRQGNPVQEILDAAKDFDLLVVGSSNKEQSFFSPNVGDQLARKAPCSVLMVTG